ncbi:MAG: hypothetical protein E6J73_05745 [Deltaproteobacteria bacterium]|nr:MAG: hypothetical protein E6J73_05745 [Deltaproteobacteria bacterium]
MALGEEIGMGPLAAHCQLGLGAVHAACGEIDRARTGIVAARERYREMAMTRWQDRAEASLRNLSH